MKTRSANSANSASTSANNRLFKTQRDNRHSAKERDLARKSQRSWKQRLRCAA